jgi:uncharacterized protein YggE
MKVKILLLCLLCLFSARTLYSQANVNTTDSPKISADGVGTVSAFPNAANITLALKFVKPTLKEAITENQRVAKEVMTVVKRFVTDTTAIKISLISTDKIMRWNQQLKKEVFAGFESSQKIILTLNDLNAMMDFTESIMKTKIYEIEKISYFHTKGAEFVKQAQELAVTDAIETTSRLAKAAKTTTGRIVYIHTDSSPANAQETTDDSYDLRTFNKGMELQGVSSSGQLLNFTVRVTVHTLLE